MSSDTNKRTEESNFSFATRELRAARVAQALEVKGAPLKVIDEDRGGDPYNTSGSFDRRNNWSKVGRR